MSEASVRDVDTHDPAGMARWLRERSDAAAQFLALTDDQQRQQFLRSWQQNVLPHLAFRFKQAAEMIERQQCLEPVCKCRFCIECGADIKHKPKVI